MGGGGFPPQSYKLQMLSVLSLSSDEFFKNVLFNQQCAYSMVSPVLDSKKFKDEQNQIQIQSLIR